MPKRVWVVETNPGNGHQAGAETTEPCINKFIGRPGLAAKVGAAELHRACRSTAAHDILQEAGHNKSVAPVNCALCPFARPVGTRLCHNVSFGILDSRNEVGRHPETAVCKYRIATHHLHRGHVTGTQRHGQIRRMIFRLKTKAGDVILRILWRYRLQYAHRDEVFGFNQCRTKTHRPLKLAIEVFRLPRLRTGLTGVESQR